MAGYYLYSLDWDATNSFFNATSEKDISQFAEIFSCELGRIQERLNDEDMMKSWPTDPAKLNEYVSKHFALKNWYRDFSGREGDAWEYSLFQLFENERRFSQKYHGDDHIYWNVIDEAIGHHMESQNEIPELKAFGRRPFCYEEPEGEEMDWYWHPTHSLHTADETNAIANQIRSAEKTILEKGESEDYQRLCQAFDQILPEHRSLFVRVDT